MFHVVVITSLLASYVSCYYNGTSSVSSFLYTLVLETLLINHTDVLNKNRKMTQWLI